MDLPWKRGKVMPVTSYIDSGFSLPSAEAFEKAVTKKTRAIMICNPNNTKGYLYSPEEWETLRQLALKYNLYLFSDEAYREFCYEGSHFSAMQLEGMDENVVLMDTISKRYSACGGRIGSFITRNKELHDIVMKFAQAGSAPFILPDPREAAVII
jgi:aspartate aminotransferase